MLPQEKSSILDKRKTILPRFITLQKLGICPFFRCIEAQTDNRILYKGKWMIQLASNDYLGLSQHPKVKEASIKAVEKYGTSCCGSRWLNGTLDIHLELEERLARFFGKESALVFSAGFLTNLGAISSLTGRNDIIFADRDDHASIIDGTRLSFAKTIKFKHNDISELEKLLSGSDTGKGKFIVIEGVYSMLGDLCHLPAVVELRKKFGFRLMVDEAHGIGVLGQKGRGAVEHFGLMDKVDIIMGTFSKSLASQGGFLAGDKDVLARVQYASREMMFTASLTPASTAAALAALTILENEPGHIARLWENVSYMQKCFSELGFNVAGARSAIIPIMVPGEHRVCRFGKMLEDDGIFTNVVLSPAVSSGGEIIRTSYKATHSKDDLDLVLDAFKKAGKALSII